MLNIIQDGSKNLLVTFSHVAYVCWNSLNLTISFPIKIKRRMKCVVLFLCDMH